MSQRSQEGNLENLIEDSDGMREVGKLGKVTRGS